MNDAKIILLVEDNPDDVLLTKRALKQNNIVNQLVVAEDGVAALDYLCCTGPHAGRNADELPSLILLDLKLPRIDGHEVLRRIRADERLKYLPVVILTSSRETEDLISAYQNGATSYIRKPVDFMKFVEAVQNLGIYWLLLNEPMPTQR